MSKQLIFDCYGVLYVNGQQNEQLLDFIQALSSDYKVAVLTSLPRNSFDRIFTTDQQQDYFDAVFCAEDVMYPKHDPRCYQEMLNKLKAEPTESIFIDDSVQNLEAAELSGITTVLCAKPTLLITQLKSVLKIT